MSVPEWFHDSIDRRDLGDVLRLPGEIVLRCFESKVGTLLVTCFETPRDDPIQTPVKVLGRLWLSDDRQRGKRPIAWNLLVSHHEWHSMPESDRVVDRVVWEMGRFLTEQMVKKKEEPVHA